MVKLLVRLIRNLLLISFSLLMLMGFSIILSSCNKFEGDVTVPAFLQVDTVFFVTDNAIQGDNSHQIVDLWIYVDDQQMGVFELPAKFPLLYNGKHKLEIRAGIKLNGISSTRAPYPMYKPIVLENFEFHPDSVQKLNNLIFTYYNQVKFPWIENFENGNLTLEETQNSDTSIVITNPVNSPEAFLSENSKYSGQINLSEERSYYNAWTFYDYELPDKESPVLLELDFKTDTYVTVGLLVHYAGGYDPKPLVILNHSDHWNHIYINLTPTVSAYPNAIDFKILFEANIESGSELANIYLDNIKLTYRDNN